MFDVSRQVSSHYQRLHQHILTSSTYICCFVPILVQDHIASSQFSHKFSLFFLLFLLFGNQRNISSTWPLCVHWLRKSISFRHQSKHTVNSDNHQREYTRVLDSFMEKGGDATAKSNQTKEKITVKNTWQVICPKFFYIVPYGKKFDQIGFRLRPTVSYMWREIKFWAYKGQITRHHQT